jgi:hypothetical protein
MNSGCVRKRMRCRSRYLSPCLSMWFCLSGSLHCWALGAGRVLRGPRSGPFGADDGGLVDVSFEAMRESRRGVLWGVWGSLEEDIFICVNVDDGKVRGWLVEMGRFMLEIA